MKRLVVASGGALETALLPYHLVHLRSLIVADVRSVVSSGALRFVTENALQAITGNTVAVPGRLFDPLTTKPMHLQAADAHTIVVYPTTPRVVSQMALGEVTCPVTEVVAFAEKEACIISGALHPKLDARLYARYFGDLEAMGCTVVRPAPGRSVWPAIESLLQTRFKARRSDRNEVVNLSSLA